MLNPRQAKVSSAAVQVEECFGGAHPGFAPAPVRDDLMMLFPNRIAMLTEVRQESGFLFLDDGGNIDVGVGTEPFGLAAGIHFEKIELRTLAERHPGPNGEKARDLMIHMRVDGPMSENDVRTLVGYQFAHGVDLRAGDLGRAVDLAEEKRFGAHDFAGCLAFPSANRGGLVQGLPGNATLTTSEINDARGVSFLRVACERSGATALGIVRMTSYTNHFQFAIAEPVSGQGGKGKSRGQSRGCAQESSACDFGFH